MLRVLENLISECSVNVAPLDPAVPFVSLDARNTPPTVEEVLMLNVAVEVEFETAAVAVEPTAPLSQLGRVASD